MCDTTKSDLGNIRDDEQEQFKKAAKSIIALSDEQLRKLIENGQFPRRPPKVPHLWPPKLLHPARGDLMH